MLLTSSITYFPLGFKSAKNGILSDTDWISSMVKVIPTEWAMAMRCRTALVDPPRTMVKT